MKAKRITKQILKWSGLAVLVLLVGTALLLFISYWRSSNDCESLGAAPGDKMKAVVYCDYGPPNVLNVR